MRLAALLLTLLLTAGCSGCASLPPPKSSFTAVVRIEFDNGLCSGTAVAAHTILSAAHCFVGARTASPSSTIDIQSTWWWPTMAAITSWCRVGATQGRIARMGRPPRWGQMLAMVGNPVGFFSLYREGRVAGWEDDGRVRTSRADASNT